MNSLVNPRDVQGVPSEQVVNRAMALVAALGAKDGIEELLIKLKEAAEFNQGLIKTATDLKSEHNRRESELDKREAALREDERKVSEVVKRNQVLKNNLATAADSFDQLKSELTTHKGQLDGKLVEITSNLNTTVHKLSAIRGLFND